MRNKKICRFTLSRSELLIYSHSRCFRETTSTRRIIGLCLTAFFIRRAHSQRLYSPNPDAIHTHHRKHIKPHMSVIYLACNLLKARAFAIHCAHTAFNWLSLPARKNSRQINCKRLIINYCRCCKWKRKTSSSCDIYIYIYVQKLVDSVQLSICDHQLELNGFNWVDLLINDTRCVWNCWESQEK